MRCLNQLLPALCSDWSTESTPLDCRVLHNTVHHQNLDISIQQLLYYLLPKGTSIQFSNQEGLFLICFSRRIPAGVCVCVCVCPPFCVFYRLQFGDIIIPDFQTELSDFPSGTVNSSVCQSTHSWRREGESNASCTPNRGTVLSFTLRTPLSRRKLRCVKDRGHVGPILDVSSMR
jgi:hypothetical protein